MVPRGMVRVVMRQINRVAAEILGYTSLAHGQQYKLLPLCRHVQAGMTEVESDNEGAYVIPAFLPIPCSLLFSSPPHFADRRCTPPLEAGIGALESDAKSAGTSSSTRAGLGAYSGPVRVWSLSRRLEP